MLFSWKNYMYFYISSSYFPPCKHYYRILLMQNKSKELFLFFFLSFITSFSFIGLFLTSGSHCPGPKVVLWSPLKATYLRSLKHRILLIYTLMENPWNSILKSQKKSKRSNSKQKQFPGSTDVPRAQGVFVSYRPFFRQNTPRNSLKLIWI